MWSGKEAAGEKSEKKWKRYKIEVEMIEKLEKWAHEIIGYIATWVCIHLPKNCDEWSSFIGVLIGGITLVFITLPKAWDFQKERWRKKS